MHMLYLWAPGNENKGSAKIPDLTSYQDVLSSAFINLLIWVQITLSTTGRQ